MADELGDIILERTFESRDAKGNTGTIKLRVGIPYMISDATNDIKWRCNFQILGIGSEKIKVMRGMDAIDALLMSLRIAEAYLKSYSKIKITWLSEEDLGLSFTPPDEAQTEDDDSPFQEILDDLFRQFRSKNTPEKPENHE